MSMIYMMMITTRVCRELCPHCFLFKATLSCSRLMDASARLSHNSAIVNPAMKKPRLCLLWRPRCIVLTHFIAHHKKNRPGVNDKQLDLLRRKFCPNVCFIGLRWPSIVNCKIIFGNESEKNSSIQHNLKLMTCTTFFQGGQISNKCCKFGL